MVLNSEEYIDFLTSNIKPFANTVSGRREVNCRCFYCADSSNPYKGHFYISVPREDEPSLFYCQKCGAHGIVTNDKLMEWGLYNTNMGIALTQYNAKILSLSKNIKYSDRHVYNIRNTFITDDKLSWYKLKYINDRLGISLSMNDCISNKIVLNLSDLLKLNRLSPTRNPNIVDQLDANFLGFISFDNAFVNMRNLGIREVYKTIDKRYINYNIFDKYDNTMKFYVIPTDINMLDPRPVKLHIAEGPFDILSIKYNLSHDTDRNIFAAVTGRSYKGCLRHFLTNTGLYNLEIHIYLDNDQSLNQAYGIRDLLQYFNIKLFVHRNTYPNEKDYGVPKDRIIDSIVSM